MSGIEGTHRVVFYPFAVVKLGEMACIVSTEKHQLERHLKIVQQSHVDSIFRIGSVNIIDLDAGRRCQLR